MHLETMLWLIQHFCSSCNRIDVCIVISKEDIFAFYQQLITLSENISSCSYAENILKHNIEKERIIFKKMHIS